MSNLMKFMMTVIALAFLIGLNVRYFAGKRGDTRNGVPVFSKFNVGT